MCAHANTKINTQNVCTGTYFFILCIKQTNLHTFPCAFAVVHLFAHPCADIHSYIPTSQYIPCVYVFNSIKKSLFFTAKHTPERPSAVLWTADWKPEWRVSSFQSWWENTQNYWVFSDIHTCMYIGLCHIYICTSLYVNVPSKSSLIIVISLQEKTAT